MKETDLAEPVIAWFTERGFAVYQEVAISRASWVIDIVATQRKLVWGVELKTTRSLSVLEQCWQKFSHCHRVSAAVPRARHPGRSKGEFWNKVRRDCGIGLFEVYGGRCEERDTASTRSKAPSADTLRAALRDEHKTFSTAGASDGRRWSPWRDTLQRLTRIVARNPGCSLREAIKTMDSHHYANDQSAYGSLLFCLNNQPEQVPGIEVRCVDGKKFLYPKSDGQATV